MRVVRSWALDVFADAERTVLLPVPEEPGEERESHPPSDPNDMMVDELEQDSDSEIPGLTAGDYLKDGNDVEVGWSMPPMMTQAPYK